jgi:hypothetical protein
MRRFARLLLAAGAIGALLAGLRKLLEEQAGSPASSRADESRNGAAELSREELYEKAKRLEIEGRSKMNKRELARAVAEREAGG